MALCPKGKSSQNHRSCSPLRAAQAPDYQPSVSFPTSIQLLHSHSSPTQHSTPLTRCKHLTFIVAQGPQRDSFVSDSTSDLLIPSAYSYSPQRWPNENNLTTLISPPVVREADNHKLAEIKEQLLCKRYVVHISYAEYAFLDIGSAHVTFGPNCRRLRSLATEPTSRCHTSLPDLRL